MQGGFRWKGQKGEERKPGRYLAFCFLFFVKGDNTFELLAWNSLALAGLFFCARFLCFQANLIL